MIFDDSGQSGLLRLSPASGSGAGPHLGQLDRQHATDLARLLTHGKALIITAQITALVIHLSILLSATWRHLPLLLLQAAVWTLGAGGNLLAPRLFLRMGPSAAQSLRNAFNLTLHIPFAAALGWSIGGWLFLPFLSALAAAPPTRNLLPRVLVHVACFDVVAAFTGGVWQDMVLFSGVALFFYFASNSYLRLLGNLITERDETLRELREAQRRVITQEKMASMGQLAAGIAHEINNPMCFVTANVEALLGELRQGPLTAEQHAEYRGDILPETLDGIQRVNAIVDDLRRFARGEPEKRATFDLGVEIAAAVRMAKAQLKPGQSVHVEIPARLDVMGSPGQLCQVILNLLMNGLQALSGAGKVEISARTKGGRVEVAVRDSGGGMDEATRQRLFEPFFSTKGRHGLGLGLSVVYGIVKAHDGSIEVESVLGRGTCFRIRLPLAAASSEAANPRARPS